MLSDVELVYDPLQNQNSKRDRRRFCCAFFSLSTLLVIISLAVSRRQRKEASTIQQWQFQAAVHTQAIKEHLQELYNVAKAHPSGSRAVVGAYNASAEYVANTLKERTDLQVSYQFFKVPVWAQGSSPALSMMLEGAWAPFTPQLDFQQLRYGGSGVADFSGEVAVVGDGCSADNFQALRAALSAGKGPLLALAKESGLCDHFSRSYNAQQAGASGLVITGNSTNSTSLSNSRARKVGWLAGDPLITIPVFSGSYTLYQQLAARAGQQVRWFANSSLEVVTTYNLFADTAGGKASQLVVVGAHLDSVPEGPGLNDNGSGSSLVLELAIQFSKLLREGGSKFRFAWWGAEEIGLLGSYAYVASLSQKEREGIRVALNFDMMASPNGLAGVHNGSLVPPNVSEEAIASSTALTEMFLQYWRDNDLPVKTKPMQSGSDFLPFIEKNITAGGLATGAGAKKTMQERTTFGGLADAAYDPCYHKPCDTPENIDDELLRQAAQAAAAVVFRLATDDQLLRRA